MTTNAKTHIKAEKNSGNVFADLGFPHPEQELPKARLTLGFTASSAAAASRRLKRERFWASNSRTSPR